MQLIGLKLRVVMVAVKHDAAGEGSCAQPGRQNMNNEHAQV